MTEIKISSSLPKGDGDGLGPLLADAIKNPEQVSTLIILVDTAKVINDIDAGELTPVLRIRRAELIRGPGDLRDAERLVRRAVERRTGQAQLDLEVETELEQAFRTLDLKGGSGIFQAPGEPGDEEADTGEPDE